MSTNDPVLGNDQVASSQREAEMYALENDNNLVSLLAWRCVKERAEAGGFNGLLSSDFTRARKALGAMLNEGA